MENTGTIVRPDSPAGILKDQPKRYKFEIVTGSPDRHNRQLNAEIGEWGLETGDWGPTNRRHQPPDDAFRITS